MTTIIVVVVVALVFFVSLCTVTFMVWKREEEMRTDSLRAIEANLQELGYRMTEDFSRSTRKSSMRASAEPMSIVGSASKSADPFSWTRDDEAQESERPAEHQVEVQHLDEPAENANVIETVSTSDEASSEVDNVASDIANDEQAHTDVTPVKEEEPVAEMASETMEEIDPVSDLEKIVSELEKLGTSVDVGASVTEGAPEHADENAAGAGASTNDYSVSDLNQLMSDDFEINLDDIDIPELMGGYIADYSADDIPQPKPPIGRDVGRSGRRYTAEELDMLIKE